MLSRVTATPSTVWIAGFVALAGTTFAGDPSGREIPVEVRTIDTDALRGILTSLSLVKGAELLSEGGERRIPSGELIRIRWNWFDGLEEASRATRPARIRDSITLHLFGGDVLTGRVFAADAETCTIETTDAGRVPVRLEHLRAVTSFHAGMPAQRDTVEWFEGRPDRDEDRILLTNGDVVRGFITEVGRENLLVEDAAGTTRVPFRMLVSAKFARPIDQPLEGMRAVLTLREGTRLTVTSLELRGQGVQVTLRDGQQITLSEDKVVTVDIVGGLWEPLSSHQPISFEHVPMLALAWDWAADRNVLGDPLTINGELFERGIGVHSRSILRYELGGKYREFVTSFGMDDQSGALANVNLTVRVNGTPRFDQFHVVGGKMHGPIRINVRQAALLELIVDFGDNGDLQDRFNWVEPGLIRSP